MAEMVINVPERVHEFVEDLDDLYGETTEDKVIYALRSFIDRDPPPYKGEEGPRENPLEVG